MSEVFDVTFDWKKELKDVSQLKVRDKLDYAELIRLQVNRCLMSLSDIKHPEMFRSHVEGLLKLIPENVWDDGFRKEIESCTERKIVEKPQYSCGVLLQPIPQVEELVTDYHKMFGVCISKIHALGMAMNIKEVTIIP